MSRPKGISAEELMAELAADEEWVARDRHRDSRTQRVEADVARASEPILAELGGADRGLTTIWDLVNQASATPADVPILLAHLDRNYPDKVTEGIARALSSPAAEPYWPQVADVYEKTRENSRPGTKEGLAVAVMSNFTPRRQNTLRKLLMNPANGWTRIYLAQCLDQLCSDCRQHVLTELARHDPAFVEASGLYEFGDGEP